MNERLRDTLDAITRYKTSHGGCSPSVRWLCDELGIQSTSTMNRRLRQLRDAGFVTFPDGQVRGINVVGGEWRVRRATAPASREKLHGLLRNLCSAQDDCTHHNETSERDALRVAQARRADAWDAVVEFVDDLAGATGGEDNHADA